MKTYVAEKVRLAGIAALLVGAPVLAQPYIVKEGQPQAEIIIAAEPARTVKLAAKELQAYVAKISGATLPIVTTPGPAGRVQIYVGRSQFTDSLKMTDEGLEHGAFKMASGKNYVVLLGRDRDFTPREPYARNRDDIPRVLERWDALTGEKWENPVGTRMFQHYNKDLNIWVQDERGSLNAVYEFLRLQGVRWYLPDALGEIVPNRPTIELPAVNRTVRPDFVLRYPHSNKRFGNQATPREEILWQLRMGFNNAPDFVGLGEIVHGMKAVHGRSEVRSSHPDYFFVRGGKRDTENRGAGRPCLSSEGLLQQNVKYVRAMFDLYDEPMVSVMPVDSYATLCECDLCKGKGTPERGFHGQISDYVWGYVNRVAQEVYKTHPNKKISCLAYGGYLLPPTKIDRLSPNLVVGIAQARRDFYDREKQQEIFIPKQKGWLDNIAEIRSGWLKKLPEGQRRIWNFEYYNLEHRTQHSLHSMPVFFPRTVARDLRALRGTCWGDFIDMYRDADGIRDMATNHLNLYVTARFWWDARQDIDALLEEYYALFYGPAREEMKAFLEYAEANWMEMGRKPERISHALELLGKAKQKVTSDSAYDRRIALIADYVMPLKERREPPASVRGNVPGADRKPKR